MEQTTTATAQNLWRVWVDTRRRIVSFHEEEDCKLLEFRSGALFSAASSSTRESSTAISNQKEREAVRPPALPYTYIIQ